MHSKRIQEKVKQDYETIAEDFSQTRQFPWKDFDCFLPYYKAHFSVLDLGCGNGRLLQFLKKYGYKSYLGVDQSPSLLNYARKAYPKEKFLLKDMTKPLKEKFDALFSIASFHHLSPDQQLSTLKQWKQALKPGGFLFMTNWNLHAPRFWPLWLRSLLCPSYGFRGLLIPWQNQLRRYYFAFSRRRLNRLLQKAGFKVLVNDYVRNGETAKLFTGKNILTIARYENL